MKALHPEMAIGTGVLIIVGSDSGGRAEILASIEHPP